MTSEVLKLVIGDAEIPSLYEDLLRLEVDLDEELAGMFRFSLALSLRSDGSWTYLDDGRLSPWQKVTVSGGPAGAAAPLISGYITHVLPSFGEGLDQCRLDVWGMDASVLLDRDEVLKAWTNKKDSAIAEDTFRLHGLTPVVTDTFVVHNEEVSTILQRETDMRFLRRLALRNGFECFVDGATGYFQPPGVDAPTQPALVIQAGDQTNVTQLSLQVNVLMSTGVRMRQVGPIDKEEIGAEARPGAQRSFGDQALSSFLPKGVSAGSVVVAGAVTTGNQEMASLCQGLYDQGEWFVTGEGEVDGSRYPGVLKPRAPVDIRGIGRVHSGTYYVTRVSHVFTPDGYRQAFGVKRNALGATGTSALGSLVSAVTA